MPVQAQQRLQAIVNLHEAGFTSGLDMHMHMQNKLAQQGTNCSDLHSYGSANVQVRVIPFAFTGTEPGDTPVDPAISKYQLAGTFPLCL